MKRSFKIRRTVSIPKNLIIELNKASIDRFFGEKSPTMVASMIFDGRSCAIEMSGTCSGYKSISMTEAMYLSIKSRSDNNGSTVRKTAISILTGAQRPLSKTEIDEGSRIANVQERRRAEMAGVTLGHEQQPAAPKGPAHDDEKYHSGTMLL